VAWTAGGSAAVLVGVVGIAVALAPDLWSTLFTRDAAVLASARSYFRAAGPAYAFFGLALVLYFASQGSGKILGPVLAQSVRLLTVLAGGAWLAGRDAQAADYFALVGVSLTAYGLATAFAVWRVSWAPGQATARTGPMRVFGLTKR
jgi:Na+-driven multidrug efflux pump